MDTTSAYTNKNVSLKSKAGDCEKFSLLFFTLESLEAVLYIYVYVCIYWPNNWVRLAAERRRSRLQAGEASHRD